jgi:nitroreductase
MSNPVLEAISKRRSIRAYKEEPLAKEQIDALLTAARESPSARNKQPWHITVVRNKSVLAEVHAEAKKNLGLNHEDIFYDAPVVLFISAEKGWQWSKVDAGILAQTVALAAQSLGLGSVILGLPDGAFQGAKTDYFNELLKFPSDYEFAVAIAVGAPSATKGAHEIAPNKVQYVD